MADTTEVASLRVPRGTVAMLKQLAHRRSLERGRDVTWSSLVREVLEHLLGAGFGSQWADDSIGMSRLSSFEVSN